MTILSWKDTYSMGVERLDEQHRELFALGERLAQAMKSGSESTVVAEGLRELVAYTQTHFREEEDLMAQISYREMAHHVQLHRTFVLHLTGYLKRLKMGKAVTAEELVQFIQKWLTRHILGEDIKIAHELRRIRETQPTAV